MQQSIELTQVTEWDGGETRTAEDCLATEEPLEIRHAGKSLTVTMRTPGHDKELAAGLLLTEGLIESRDQIAAIRQADLLYGPGDNLVEVELAAGNPVPEPSQRNFVSASGCGVCGKATIQSIHRRGLRSPADSLSVAPEILCRLPDRLRERQKIFGRTGGLHAAALFNAAGELLELREDIGRHNAVDKLIGWALLSGLMPLSNHVMMVSGRGGFEIVQKALAAGVPILASVSAPSSLAVKLAREFDQTLVGFLRGKRFVVYSGQSRCIPAAA
ncbi:MAG TPA: formate dehydrogenase accessory sulfurtransferase FdhD [Terracidiphilus sp.]|nr:formate dehydrogenase accessory sulfurtransferase FdhD [Terracidiphilus sp.]